MAFKLDDLSVAQLEKLISDSQEKIRHKLAQQEKLVGLRAEVERLAREAGVHLHELTNTLGTTADKVKQAARKPVEIKFRNPLNALETWTGRGRQPRWVAAALAAGKKLEDLRL